jgi:hypothetical protein
LAFFIFSGCVAETVTRTSLNRNLLQQEDIWRIVVLPFDSPMDDLQAGSHISQLFEMQLIQTGFYQIAERSAVEKAFRDRRLGKSPEADLAALRQLREQLGIDGIILGSVSQYNRVNLGFTARLVSLKSGLIIWSISQTGGRVLRPLSQVAAETVQAAVKDLQSKMQ